MPSISEPSKLYVNLFFGPQTIASCWPRRTVIPKPKAAPKVAARKAKAAPKPKAACDPPAPTPKKNPAPKEAAAKPAPKRARK